MSEVSRRVAERNDNMTIRNNGKASMDEIRLRITIGIEIRVGIIRGRGRAGLCRHSYSVTVRIGI